MKVKATVIIPTHSHGPLLRHAVNCVLSQTLQDFELLIIGDGADEETREVAHAAAAADSRIEFFDYPKDARRGEVYRHQQLQQARGEIVCYLCDDHLWFPNHLAEMYAALQQHNFAHAMTLFVRPDGGIECLNGDLELGEFRRQLADGVNFIGLTCGGHRLDFYHSLPHGWRSTPAGIFTDLYMWQQFAAHPGLRPLALRKPTALLFNNVGREGWNNARREAELAQWKLRLETPESRHELLEQITGALADADLRLELKLRNLRLEHARLLEENSTQARKLREHVEVIRSIERTPWWRIKNAVRRGVGLR